MDAKNRVNFINSVAGEQAVPYPKYNTANEPGGKFYISCGAKLSTPAATNDIPTFATVAENLKQISEKPARYVETASVFADGLLSWDIVPPQVMVRRSHWRQ